MKITILGSGTSTGVPEIGCKCPVCTSSDPRDNRLRCSGLVETEGLRILIDCGPDFREQMIRLNDFKPLDGVLITHEHYDHVGGLDDLRPFCRFRDVPVYAEQYTAERLRQRIPYCFAEHLYPGVPRITLEEIVPARTGCVGNECIASSASPYPPEFEGGFGQCTKNRSRGNLFYSHESSYRITC